VIARRAVWVDAKVKRLAERFLPVADEVGMLQRAKTKEGELFRRIAEQGHYAGRSHPTDTRQGLYAAAPSGVLLASINHNDPSRVAAMLEKALAAWEALPGDQRRGEGDVGGFRWESLRPEDGLVLRVTTRDLARDLPAEAGWRARAWNRDVAWFRRAEARSFLPEDPRPGSVHDVPAPLVRRLARLHLADVVRGQSPPYAEGDVKEARLTATVTRVEGSTVHLRLEGRASLRAEGTWSTGGISGAPPTPQVRAFDGRLLGRATFDLAEGRFTRFSLLAVGMRRGATQYNGRADDPGPAPQGVAFTLAGDTPADRVAPAAPWAYGWR
jgi:hypothetical protein